MNILQIQELKSIIDHSKYQGDYLLFKETNYAISDPASETLLSAKLYNEYYSKKLAFQASSKAPEPSFHIEDPNFTQALSESNHSKDRIESGWNIKNILPGGWVEITKNSQSKIVGIDKIKRQYIGYSVSQEDVPVLFPREERTLQKGFYYVNSNELFDTTPPLLRVYWNIISEGAAPLIAAITSTLNRYNIPFLFKCVNHPSSYIRRDAAVLYFEFRYYAIISNLLPQISHEVKMYLHDDVPLFTYPYQPGIGIAENPNTNESFGTNRMMIVASALLEKPNIQNQSASSRMEQIALAFSSKGLDINHPYLNKGSKIKLN